MSRSQSETVIKNIFREIEQQCAQRGNPASETLVAFMVKTVVLDPRNGFNVDRKLTDQDVQKLQQMCVDKLMEECSPSLDTIKMQVYFDMNYPSRREFMEESQREQRSRLSSVSREITDSRVTTREELEALYSKIITYILLRSGLGDHTSSSTVREATAALQSVFPQVELGAFMSLMRKDKEQQLSELSMIVTGIRLFNKLSKKEEEEVHLKELMPPAHNGALPATVEEELSAARRLAWKYTALLEKLMDQDAGSAELHVPAALLKQALYNVRQHEALLKVIMADAGFCGRQVEMLQTEFTAQLQLLKETMQLSKAAIPTAKVFPLFKALSQLRSGLQDEVGLLSVLDNTVTTLRTFIASQSQLFSEASLDSLLEGSEVKTDQQRMATSSGECIDPVKMAAHKWLFPETTMNFNELPLQYNGVCGYALVKRDGLLLPGNPHIGILKHKEKLYVFSSKEVAVKFASRADDFIAEVAERAKRSPELIQLLKLHQQFACVTPYSEMRSGGSLLVKPGSNKCDSGTQTELHPVETHIDRSYEWNEWELRRKAIKLANLRTQMTHATQTDRSHRRRDNVTQVYLPKDAACQTKRDGQSGMPRPLVYLAGLRGQRSGRVIKTDLTTSMDE
ncbi:cilia- and flagella-associated protein 206 [Genypterus blacodes]|uniref:cilia- and flagella-associated protein 206 n=1 Tax=Genypterus blacodes TaxID=154954 RepID=UPI003F75AFAD